MAFRQNFPNENPNNIDNAMILQLELENTEDAFSFLTETSTESLQDEEQQNEQMHAANSITKAQTTNRSGAIDDEVIEQSLKAINDSVETIINVDFCDEAMEKECGLISAIPSSPPSSQTAASTSTLCPLASSAIQQTQSLKDLRRTTPEIFNKSFELFPMPMETMVEHQKPQHALHHRWMIEEQPKVLKHERAVRFNTTNIATSSTTTTENVPAIATNAKILETPINFSAISLNNAANCRHDEDIFHIISSAHHQQCLALIPYNPGNFSAIYQSAAGATASPAILLAATKESTTTIHSLATTDSSPSSSSSCFGNQNSSRTEFCSYKEQPSIKNENSFNKEIETLQALHSANKMQHLKQSESNISPTSHTVVLQIDMSQTPSSSVMMRPPLGQRLCNILKETCNFCFCSPLMRDCFFIGGMYLCFCLLIFFLTLMSYTLMNSTPTNGTTTVGYIETQRECPFKHYHYHTFS